jgi:hypothetical protein
VGSSVSEMVFVWWLDFWWCGRDRHGGRVLTQCRDIFCMVRAWKKMSRVRTLLKLIPELVACELSSNLLMTTFGTSDYMFTTKLQPPELSVTTMLQPPELSGATMLQPPESSVTTMLQPSESSVMSMLHPPESSVTTQWQPFVFR